MYARIDLRYLAQIVTGISVANFVSSFPSASNSPSPVPSYTVAVSTLLLRFLIPTFPSYVSHRLGSYKFLFSPPFVSNGAARESSSRNNGMFLTNTSTNKGSRSGTSGPHVALTLSSSPADNDGRTNFVLFAWRAFTRVMTDRRRRSRAILRSQR